MEGSTKPSYRDLYDRFINDYHKGITTGADVGEIIVRLASDYAQLNIDMVNAEKRKNAVAAINIGKTDETTGKAITVAKAEVLTDASPENDSYNIARAHLVSCEQMINALKSLQKGILNEYANSSL